MIRAVSKTSTIASICDDHVIVSRNGQQQNLHLMRRKLDGLHLPMSLLLSDDGTTLIVFSDDGKCVVYRADENDSYSWKCSIAHNHLYRMATWSSDCTKLALCDETKTVHVLDLSSGKYLLSLYFDDHLPTELYFENNDKHISIAFSIDHRHAGSHRWEIASARRIF